MRASLVVPDPQPSEVQLTMSYEDAEFLYDLYYCNTATRVGGKMMATLRSAGICEDHDRAQTRKNGRSGWLFG